MTATSPKSRIAILAAMAPELAPLVRRLRLAPRAHDFGRVHVGTVGGAGPLGGCEVVAAVTSMGTAAAARVTHALLDALPCDHVIVTGIAGGVAEGLSLGELVSPAYAVLDADRREARATPFGPVPLAGRLLTTDTLHNDAASVARLRAEGFVVVDMETAAIGLAAESRGVPWTAFRAVSDFAGDPIVDADVVGLSRPDGTPDARAIARFVVTRPWRLGQLARLGRGMRLAVRASTEAVLAALG